jgi:unsaturated rhamnogalacturonyl hydrolase
MKIKLNISCFILLCCLLCVSFSKGSTPLEWAMKVVESTMTRNSPASELGSWGYQKGFYLYGQYRVWEKVGDIRYYQYIEDWLDSRIDDNGNFNKALDWLDNMQPGLITLYCYEKTGKQNYKKAADKIRQAFDTYPRTSDGAFWHAKNKVGQLWLDGVYMSMPFLMKYGQLFGDSVYAHNEASQQIILYANHLKDTTGLLYHAYDEDGSEPWADPVTHHSAEFWGRAMGWFGMTIIEILEILPKNHPNRAALIEILGDLIAGLARYQDKETGLWYQVTNKGENPENWHESSCSCMYTFYIARAVERDYIDSSYINVALKGYEGILTKISTGNDSLTLLKDISQGTSVGDYNYYINRKRNTNDLHGLGAFLLVSLEMSKHIDYDKVNQAPYVSIISPDHSSNLPIGSDIPIITTAFDIDGDVIQVEFYEGENLLSTDTQEPWKYIWPNVAEGDYILTAVAYDDSNASTTSAPIHILVSNDSLIFQAEIATIAEGSIDNEHPGYTGTGYVNLNNKTGTYLEWSLTIPAAGDWICRFRFANGSSNDRPCRIDVNGTIAESSFNFKSTGNWQTWEYSQPCTLNFESGNNTFRVTGITSESAPNLDYIVLNCIDTSCYVNEAKPLQTLPFALNQNYPNPFNPVTKITYSIQYLGKVNLSIFNMTAQHIVTLVDDIKTPGTYTVEFDASKLTSGIYLYKLRTNIETLTRKMLLVR